MFEAHDLFIDSVLDTEKASFKLSGNAKMSVIGSVNLGISADAKGKQEIIISGGDNSAIFQDLNMAGDSDFKLEGSGNSVIAMGSFNMLEGQLSFVADTHGITLFELGVVSAFDGILVMDFSVLKSDDILTLVSASEDWSDIANALISSERWNREDSNGNIYDIFYDADTNSLMASYTNVPESSVYAAFFCALALAFSLYKRRGRK